MEMMRKLLDSVGKSWERIPKDVPVISIQKGSGVHTMCTVAGSQLYMHSMPFDPNLPVKQSVLLDDLSFEELTDVLNSMGYVASITSEVRARDLEERKAHTLQHVEDLRIQSPSELKTFTSKMWERLHPIAKLLEIANYDVEVAIQQMLATSTRGKWLEYWASFFGIRRIAGELDDSLRKRIFTMMANIKSNNIAIEELVRYVVQDTITVTDKAPALMEIVTNPKYMDKGNQLHQTLMAVKAGGIDYILNFMQNWEEDFRSYIQDKTGKPFLDLSEYTVQLDSFFEELRFGYGEMDIGTAFILNRHRLNGGKVMSPGIRYKLKDELTMRTDFEDVFPVNRRQPLEGKAYFRMNSGKLNSPLHTLYGEGSYGDIMESIQVVCSEAYAVKGESFESPYATVQLVEQHYQEPVKKGVIGFRIGTSKLGSTARLAKKDTRTVENGFMVMTLGETVLQQIAW